MVVAQQLSGIPRLNFLAKDDNQGLLLWKSNHKEREMENEILQGHRKSDKFKKNDFCKNFPGNDAPFI